MCGIIGYVGKKDARDILLNGLKKLEYRGYDSWGMATVSEKQPEIQVHKKVGGIGKAKETPLPYSSTGIAHTRWATHGKVDLLNAHPHFSKGKKVAIVHNGIIENFQSLRKMLEKNGYDFLSSCDSEVIAHLIDFEVSQSSSFREAVARAVAQLEGAYAIVAIRHGSEEMIAVKKDSPLVVGIGEGEQFVASDVPAFLDHTRKVIFLEDDEMAVLNSKLEIIDLLTMKPLEREPEEIDWNTEQAQKGDFEHYMMKEIAEQTDTLKHAIGHPDSKLMEMAKKINDAYGVFFVACGSSYHSALTASYLFSKITRKHINVVIGSEFPNYEHFLTDKTLLVTISQSGETADVLAAVKTAKKKGAKVLSIVNVFGSSLMRNSDYTLSMNAGPEICVLSTKSYTSQLAILTLLAYACIGKLSDGKAMLNLLADQVEKLTSPKTQVKIVKLASKLHESNDMFTIGRGLNYGTALEAALKIKEVSYIHAEGFPGGELKHGTIALIEEGTPAIVFVANDDTKKEILSNAMELKSRGAYIVGVGPEPNEIFDFHIKVPDAGDASPIVNIIPVQVLAYYLAVFRDCDPDKPRNLAKSVTVK